MEASIHSVMLIGMDPVANTVLSPAVGSWRLYLMVLYSVVKQIET